jgi:hypothetical protein
MTPIGFKIINGTTHFHYKATELIDFVRRGKRDGNVGLILMKRNGDLLTYKGFGTIENPSTHILSITISHCTPFDGDMPTDEQRLILSNPLFTKDNTKIAVLDMSNIKKSKLCL